MILNHGRKWLISILVMIPTVNLQIPVPILPMSAPFGYAAPAPVPMAFQLVEISRKRTTTTTTESPEKTIGIAIPVAMPAPVQVAVPAYPAPLSCSMTPRPINCPVCPPCSCFPCTPAFFSYCSPCHQKCRCNGLEDTPIPLPRNVPVPLLGPAYPMPVPLLGPPGFILPIHKQRKPVSESSESESCSSEWPVRFRRGSNLGGKSHKGRKKNYSRSQTDMNDKDFAKPVLSYITKDGVVRMEQQLSNDEAAELMEENKVQNINVESDLYGGVRVVSENRVNAPSELIERRHKHKQVVLSTNQAERVMAEGKKELIFRPPGDKKISNLSVSFQIA